MHPITRDRQPFQEQIDFFRQKVNVPTATWRDVWQSTHDRAFTVAGAAKADLLNDFRNAVDASIADGMTIDEFAKQFDQIVSKHGWEYNGTRDWRLRVIYTTNMSSSYNAGRLAQLRDPDLQTLKPYWMYKHNDSVENPRPLHQSWDGITLPADDPWFQTHAPPNGWGCRCRLVAVSEKEAKADGGRFGPAPDDGTGDTGTPNGIDEGWGYMPGNLWAGQDFANKKAASLPPPLAKAFTEEQKQRKGFEPQKTAPKAAQWAMDNDLADFVDYKGIKPEVANAWNQSLFEHLNDFPELRKNQRYTGTAQGQFRRYHELMVSKMVTRLRDHYPDAPESNLIEAAKRRVKKPKTKGETYAHSWDQELVSGIAVNQKWGKAPDEFKSALRRDVDQGYHPVGTDAIKSVVDHELGHQLDTLLGLSKDTGMVGLHSQYRDQIGDTLSRYAAKNIAEFIAEGWAEYRNNPDPREIARAIGELVHAKYEKFRL